MDNAYLFNVFVFLAAACLVVPLASRFKLGAVLGYLIAGVIIGPYGLGLIDDAERVMHFAEFGVVMMLFVIGLELEPAILWRLRKSILGLGGSQVIVTAVAFTGVGLLLGFSWQMSLTIGMALSLSSTALVLKILEERNLMNTTAGETAFSVLLFQDIAVIPILIIMPLLAVAGSEASQANHTIIADYPGWMRTLIILGAIATVILASRYLSQYLFKLVARSNLREVFTATSLAIVIGITLLMELVGVSPALGAFVAGVVLANSEYRRTIETDIEPFKGLLLGLFFISIGMGMDFNLFADTPFTLLAAVAVLVLIKGAILFVLGKFSGMQLRQNYGFAFILAQGGEFAFVLFQFAGTLDILPPAMCKFFIMVVALSIAVTPLLMLFYTRMIVPKFMSTLPDRAYDKISEYNPVILAGFGRFGQVVGRFLMSQGVKITVLEKDPDQIESIRRFGFKSYFGDAAHLDFLRSAGAATAKILIVAVDDAAAALEIVELAKEQFPNLKVYARARNRRHAYELYKAGVDYFKRETFESSLDMAQQIMIALGRKPSDMQYRANQFRRHDESSLRASFAFFENEPELVNFSRTQIAELEQILQSDLSEEVEHDATATLHYAESI